MLVNTERLRPSSCNVGGGRDGGGVVGRAVSAGDDDREARVEWSGVGADVEGCS